MDTEQGKIVSVIEDDPVFCRVLQQHLEAYGYRPAIYNTVKDFLQHQKAQPYAIILDHFLGANETGFESLRLIRKKMPKVSVIYLTQLSKEELPANFDKSGIYAYIGKDSASLIRSSFHLG